jgi:hypothetical protein
MGNYAYASHLFAAEFINQFILHTALYCILACEIP